MAADPEPVYTQSWTTAGYDSQNFMSGFSYTVGNNYASFKDSNTPWKKSENTSYLINGSFTMVMDLKNVSAVYNGVATNDKSVGQDIFSIQFGNDAERNLEFQIRPAGDDGTTGSLLLVEDVRTKKTTTESSTTLTLDSLSSWTTITLIADWEQQQLSLYAGSDLVGRIDNWSTNESITMTGVQFGAQLDGGGSNVNMSNKITGEMQINNIAIYNGAQYQLAVPEPATATLSLLALAGLCARRRRKAA